MTIPALYSRFFSGSALLALLFVVALTVVNSASACSSSCLINTSQCDVSSFCPSVCHKQCLNRDKEVCRSCLVECGTSQPNADCWVAVHYRATRCRCHSVVKTCSMDETEQIALGGVCTINTLGVVMSCLAGLVGIVVFLVLWNCSHRIFPCCTCLQKPKSEFGRNETTRPTMPLATLEDEGDYSDAEDGRFGLTGNSTRLGIHRLKAQSGKEEEPTYERL